MPVFVPDHPGRLVGFLSARKPRGPDVMVLPPAKSLTALGCPAVMTHDLPDMDIVIRDRTEDLTAQDRAYVDKKVRGLGDHLNLITSAYVEFNRDVKRRPEPLYVVKITLHLLAHRLTDLRVKETGRDQRGTFDVAMTRMEADAVQLKESIKAHR